MSIKLTHEHDILACVQYKPALIAEYMKLRKVESF